MSVRLERLAGLLTAVHPVEPTGRILGHLWGKVAVGAYCVATALVDVDVLELLAEDERLPSFGELVAEVARVAAAEGWPASPSTASTPTRSSARTRPASERAGTRSAATGAGSRPAARACGETSGCTGGQPR